MNGKRTLEAVQDVGGGRVLRGVAGRGSSYIWAGEKIPCTLARLLICCPSPLPFPSSSSFLVVSCGLDAVADSRRDGMQAGGCCLLVGKLAGRLSVCLCPLSLSFGVLGVVLALACWVLGVLCWAGLAWAAGRGWSVSVLGGLSRPPGGVLSVILHKVSLENTA